MIHKTKSFLLIFIFLLSACNSRSNPTPTTMPVQGTSLPGNITAFTPTPSPSPLPPRQLTICTPREPDSLFLYGDSSLAARAVREAIYDGPVDQRDYAAAPVILEGLPTQSAGNVTLQPVQVAPNDLIIDSLGNLTNLAEGVVYFPSGCTALACAQTYTGQEPVSMDQMVVQFKLRPDLLWSDGAPLTAQDSLYSFEVARALGTRAHPDLLERTQSYQALDAQTVEWRGVPGLRDPNFIQNFFVPLPSHAWSKLTASQLLTDTLTTRTPLGWGPFVISEWAPGDRLTLTRNPNYFKASEGLPYLDILVFRFLPDGDQALAALQAGECDLLDPAYGLTPQDAQVQALQQANQAAVVEIPAVAWEHLDFGINSAVVDPQRPPFFQSKEVRQAVAQCIDRQKLAADLAPGGAVLDSYAPPDHPLFNAQARKYSFDPAAASALLQASGWVDTDNDPATPRLSLGAPGVPDGTRFVVSLLASDDAQEQRLAELIKESLAQCGVQVDLASSPAEQVFAPGPDGPVFGRQFSLAQFAWPVAQTLPCFLYTTSEIPGPYPQYAKGWGGANDTGYSSPQFDQACQAALNTLPDTPEFQAAVQQAQAIFAEDLPVLPLFLRSRWVVTRPDLCGLQVDPSNLDIYWNLENFNDGEGCQ
jgi:peptide/nickel transport system substrate-binding protein